MSDHLQRDSEIYLGEENNYICVSLPRSCSAGTVAALTEKAVQTLEN